MTVDTIARGLALQAKAAGVAAQARLQFWARSYRGLQARFPVMSAPPVVTVGGSAATVNGNTGYTTTATWNGGRLSFAGGSSVVSDGSSPTRALVPVTTFDDNSTSGGSLQHLRFITSAPAFEVPLKGVTGQVNALVDGEFVTRVRGLADLPNDGNAHQVKFDFGTNMSTFYLAQVAKSAGGSGYAVGDTITLAGGTFTTAAVLSVLQVSSGAVAAVAVKIPGAYSVVPTGTIAQGSTSGAGTGATFTSPVWSQADTTRKSRRIELVYFGGGWNVPFPTAGVNVAAIESIQPWPVSPRIPRLFVMGDSQQSTYVDYAGGGMASSIAQRLGLWDNLVISNNGGTGYLTANVSTHALPWTDSRRIADIVNQAPDIVLIIGSQNDTGIAAATLSAAVTTMLNTLLGALPRGLFVGIGPVYGNSATITGALAAGYAGASDQGRVRFIDNVTTNPWISGTGKVTAPSGSGDADWMVSSDGFHLDQAGYDHWADIAAARIGDALVTMVG